MKLVSVLRGACVADPGRTQPAPEAGQPLLMVREPANPKDPNAIQLRDMMNQPIAYVCRQHASMLAPRMDAGEMFLCKYLRWIGDKCCCHSEILIWNDEVADEKVVTGTIRLEDLVKLAREDAQ